MADGEASIFAVAEPAEPVELTMALMRKVCIPPQELQGKNADEIADLLMALPILRLEFQNIKNIENLDFFTNLTDLYLQHNQISVIENLDVCGQLKFLALSNNKIACIENIKHLRKLQFLDLAENRIDDLDLQELPVNLLVLKLNLNGCCLSSSYRSNVVKRLLNLQSLDDDAVVRADAHDPSKGEVDEEEAREHPFVQKAVQAIWDVTDLAKDSTGRLRQPAYLNFNRKMYFAMVKPELSVSGAATDMDKEARLNGEEDWERDLLRQQAEDRQAAKGEGKAEAKSEAKGEAEDEGTDSIGYDVFFESMYELAEYWFEDDDDDEEEEGDGEGKEEPTPLSPQKTPTQEKALKYATFLRQLHRFIAHADSSPVLFKSDAEIKLEAATRFKSEGGDGALNSTLGRNYFDRLEAEAKLAEGRGAGGGDGREEGRDLQAEEARMVELIQMYEQRRDDLFAKAFSQLAPNSQQEVVRKLEAKNDADAESGGEGDEGDRESKQSSGDSSSSSSEGSSEGSSEAKTAAMSRLDQAKANAKSRMILKRQEILSRSKQRLETLMAEAEELRIAKEAEEKEYQEEKAKANAAKARAKELKAAQAQSQR